MSLEFLKETAILLQECREHIQLEVESTPGRRKILKKIDDFDKRLYYLKNIDMKNGAEVDDA